MSSLSRREQRAREKARPELNREHHDILVGHPYGAPACWLFSKAEALPGLRQWSHSRTSSASRKTPTLMPSRH